MKQVAVTIKTDLKKGDPHFAFQEVIVTEEDGKKKYSYKDLGVFDVVAGRLKGAFLGKYVPAGGVEQKVFKLVIQDEERADLEYVLSCFHSSVSYNILNSLLNDVNNGDYITIQLGKTYSDKFGKDFPDVKIYDEHGNSIRWSIDWHAQPKKVQLFKDKEMKVPALDSKGQKMYDSSEVVEFWEKKFKAFMERFPKAEYAEQGPRRGEVNMGSVGKASSYVEHKNDRNMQPHRSNEEQLIDNINEAINDDLPF